MQVPDPDDLCIPAYPCHRGHHGGPQSFLEKDDDEFDVRNINGVDYYILSNIDNRNVTWTVDNLQVIISGSLSDDEINSMIDSIIYEG